MSTKKLSLKAAQPKRTKEFIFAGYREIPVYELPAKTIIDSGKLLAVIESGKSVSPVTKILRVADMAPQAQSTSLLFPSFGINLIDSFTTYYGYGFRTQRGRFLFNFSLLNNTSGAWVLKNEQTPRNQHFQFYLDAEDFSLYILTVYFSVFQNQIRPILTVKIGMNTVYIDTATIYISSFDLIIRNNHQSEYIKIMLENDKQIEPDTETNIYITRIDMFQTLLAYPTDILEM